MEDEPVKRSELLQFPCRFPIKMMGRDSGDFRNMVISIVEKHTGSVDESDVRIAPSSKGNFVSVTITIDAESQQQLDDIYRDLTAHEDILVSL